jgi:hypothetical protein
VTVDEVAVDWRWIGLSPAASRSLGASIVVTDDDGDGGGGAGHDGDRNRAGADPSDSADPGAGPVAGADVPVGSGVSLPVTAEIGGGIYPRKRPSEFAAIRLAAPWRLSDADSWKRPPSQSVKP